MSVQKGKKRNTMKMLPEEKMIKKLYEEINNNLLETHILSQLMNDSKTTEIIKIILSKKKKTDQEVFIVKTFLKQLSNFMSIINKSGDEEKAEKILTKISTDLSLEVYQKNSFLMKVGEVGKNFFVTLSGKITVLVPKLITVSMSENQYKNHLIFLYSNNEKFLLEKTYFQNKNIFKFEITEVEKIEEKYIIELPLKITLEEYISRLNCENIPKIYSDTEIKQIKIFSYFNVVDLIQGSSFGEIALINEVNQRTATIFVKEDSVFGCLTASQYKNTMKKIQERIKIENIEFIFSLKIFNQIGIKLFNQNYWNYFIYEKINKGEYIFNYNDIRNKIWFIYEGEVKLVTPFLHINKLNKFIHKLTNSNLSAKPLPIIHNENVVLAHSKRGDILGLENILFEGKYICNAICNSKHCSFFSIDINILNDIKERFERVKDALDKFEKRKINLMINRLTTIKKTHDQTIHGEIKKSNLMTHINEISTNKIFDDSGQEIIFKQSELKKNQEILNLGNSENKEFKSLSSNRLSQIFFDPKKHNHRMSVKKSFMKLSSVTNLPSNLSLKFDHETGNIIDKKERKKTLDFSRSEISYTNSDDFSSNSFLSEENENENDNNTINYNNNNNYNKNYSKTINTNNNKLTLPFIGNNNTMNKIYKGNISNFKSYSTKNSSSKKITFNNLSEIKKTIVLKIPEKPKTNLIKFSPIEQDQSFLKDKRKERKKEEEIKNAMSLTEPNDIETKEYFNKIIKKRDNVTNCLSKTLQTNFLSEKGKIYHLRLFDNELEKFMIGKKKFNYFNQSNYSHGFKAKIIPPQFLPHGKKIQIKISKKNKK